MKFQLTDSHTHLDSREFEDDREQVIQRALDAGVTRILSIGAGDGLNSAPKVLRLAEKYPFIWASVGVHPHDAGKIEDLSPLREYAKHPKVVAIGETGLDFFRDWAPRDAQFARFREQILLALEVKKPIIVHSRDAALDCLAILQELDAKQVGGVFHCYSEDAAFAVELRSINFKVSFPGSVTFKNANKVQDAVREIPLDQILIETDAPYIAPAPFRGKRCESSYIVETAKQIANLKGLTLEEVAEATTTNALALFKTMR